MEKVERSFGDIVKRFFEPWDEMKWVFLRAMIFPFISSIVSISEVEITRIIVNLVQDGWGEEIYTYVYYFIWLIILRLFFRWIFKNYWASEIRPESLRVLSKTYLSKYILLDNNKIEVYGTGRLIAIFEKWISMRTEMLVMTHVDLVRQITRIIFILIYVSIINIYYGIWFTILVWLVILVYILTQKKANHHRRIRREYYIQYMSDFVKIIMSKFEILQTGNSSKELSKFDVQFPRRYEQNKKIETMRYLSEAFSVSMIDGLRVFAMISVIAGTALWKIGIWEFVALISVLVLLDNMTWDISRFYIDITTKYISLEKMRNLLDNVPVVLWYDEWVIFHHKQWDVNVQNITYAYDEQKVFDDFSLDIKWGNKTALVWVSWSGKSTLVKLIAGYLRPDSGSIIVDGQNLADTSLKSYYKHIWYLTQEPSVFDGTVSENLTYAIDGEVDKGLLDQAIKHARCEFVYDFPDGLETEIGERGIRLSGGQRQRLAIAKIFLKDPEIIILDEPTSALDSFSEEWITEAMHNLFEWRTVIIIAHRLQTVREADDIILLEDGQVTERGTHDELVARWWQYAKMLELQSWF